MFSYGFLSWFRGDPSILTMVAPLNAQIDLSAIHPTSMWVLAPFHLAGGLLSHPERCQKLEWGIRITDYNCWLEVGSCVYHFGNSHSHMCHMIKHKQLGVSFVLKMFLKCYSMLFMYYSCYFHFQRWFDVTWISRGCEYPAMPNRSDALKVPSSSPGPPWTTPVIWQIRVPRLGVDRWLWSSRIFPQTWNICRYRSLTNVANTCTPKFGGSTTFLGGTIW
jgi:hypothetical protein